MHKKTIPNKGLVVIGWQVKNRKLAINIKRDVSKSLTGHSQTVKRKAAKIPLSFTKKSFDQIEFFTTDKLSQIK